MAPSGMTVTTEPLVEALERRFSSPSNTVAVEPDDPPLVSHWLDAQPVVP